MGTAIYESKFAQFLLKQVDFDLFMASLMPSMQFAPLAHLLLPSPQYHNRRPKAWHAWFRFLFFFNQLVEWVKK